MHNFSGWHEHTIDGKGRVSIPSPFRDKLSANGDDRLFVTRSLSGPCVEVFPGSEWNRLMEKVAALPQGRPEVIQFRRRFISSATEATLDKAGRILLPGPLRSQLGLGKEVMVAGNIEKMEIWDRTVFLELNDRGDGLDVLAEMSKHGF